MEITQEAINIASQIALSASNAAANASNAANAAAEAAAQAASNAQISAKAASDSATAIAVVATDTSWMKKSLTRVEEQLNSITNSFVSKSDHLEVLDQLDDHEKRLRCLEVERTRITVLLGIASAIMSVLTSLLIWHLFQK